MRNCPNCGAPIEPYKCKCEYCGTYYYDLSSVNLSEGEPCYIQFKVNNMIVTALAIPHCSAIEITSEPIKLLDGNYQVLNSRECNISLHFRCVETINNGTLLEVKKQ